MLAGCEVIEGGVTVVVEEWPECELGPDFCVDFFCARAAVPDMQSRIVRIIARAASALIAPDFTSSSRFMTDPPGVPASGPQFEGRGFEPPLRVARGKGGNY